MLPTVSNPAILELEDDAVANLQVVAVSIGGAALDADHAVVIIANQVLQFGPEATSVFSASWPKYASVASRPW